MDKVLTTGQNCDIRSHDRGWPSYAEIDKVKPRRRLQNARRLRAQADRHSETPFLSTARDKCVASAASESGLNQRISDDDFRAFWHPLF